ncbi:hypothetical protein COU60_01680 [Candidatus Pacearchaeota archaeon CG10_big_fil_rev_8_21_14_0_10_34_76]|nr:MAG: hypothetical protein COU60_01680 [Candidatus Pacearchaeota archaeon CG10_big_fil_rev_8_21_14_0_10_34_76]
MISRELLIKKYVDFFKKKNHKEIPSSSLIPSNDPTVLFTTAGMHPLVPYLTGQSHPLGKRLVNVQKCLRTDDIDEVGDSTHHTFFEMLGNWSLGDYWKEEAIEMSFEFLTKELKIPKEKLAVSCFTGDKDSPKDEESAKIWESLKIPKEHIAFLGKKDNWWGPAGNTGPCGPDTEIFYWNHPGKNNPPPKKFNVSDKNWVEIGNNVLMQYNKDKRLILVDGMHCLYNEDFDLNSELLNFLHSFNTHYLLAVNKFRDEGRNLVKSTNFPANWEAFSLEEHKIKKDDPKYFETLLKQFNLVPEEVIYFDHDKKNVETAKKLGILSKHYDGINSIKKFITDNIYAFIPLKQKNIDFGGGVERTISILNGLNDNYLSPVFLPIVKEIERISEKRYDSDGDTKASIRIIADHIKASTMILADPHQIKPSNVQQGYIIRRLIRRAVRHGFMLGIKENFTTKLFDSIHKIYPDYEELKKNKNFILSQLDEEENKFRNTLEKGITEFEKLIKNKKYLSGKETFLLFQSYGFPIEMTEELCVEKGIKMKKSEFQKEFEKHQELSRTASSGMFKSGLADNSEKTTRLHTATHLLNESLRQVLGPDIKQRGSNITPERLRFDFNFPRKLTSEEIKKVETLVNKKISSSLKVESQELPFKKALAEGAQAEFGHKYPEKVSVYTIQDSTDNRRWFSKEICTGPHVKNTKEIGKFKILKEESSSAGVRRIKAIVE